jgi:hypothetical protein
MDLINDQISKMIQELIVDAFLQRWEDEAVSVVPQVLDALYAAMLSTCIMSLKQPVSRRSKPGR